MINLQPTGGLAIWWLDVVNFIILSLSAAFSADVFLLGFCLLTSSFIFLLDCDSGRTIFKFHNIAKPYRRPPVKRMMLVSVKMLDGNHLFNKTSMKLLRRSSYDDIMNKPAIPKIYNSKTIKESIPRLSICFLGRNKSPQM